jgi:cyclic pyranopterin phosphate synthase
MSKQTGIRMIDVGDKPITARQATAKGSITMKTSTLSAVKDSSLAKGDALTAARLAGIMAAKSTPHLIPMCHPLLIDDIVMDISIDSKNSAVEITGTVKGSGKTGFEMEALTAVTVAALTIYDMCKSIDSTLRIDNVRLTGKSGGKSGNVVLE